jgi:hypothetical protein
MRLQPLALPFVVAVLLVAVAVVLGKPTQVRGWQPAPAQGASAAASRATPEPGAREAQCRCCTPPLHSS